MEDNNLSILTKKKVRRNWEMSEVAKSFKMNGHQLDDDPKNIYKFKERLFKKPMLLNINTHRLFWHAGAGQDSLNTFDRYRIIKKKLGDLGNRIDQENFIRINKLWKKHSEKQ